MRKLLHLMLVGLLVGCVSAPPKEVGLHPQQVWLEKAALLVAPVLEHVVGTRIVRVRIERVEGTHFHEGEQVCALASSLPVGSIKVWDCHQTTQGDDLARSWETLQIVVHEMAHLALYMQYPKEDPGHGPEWEAVYDKVWASMELTVNWGGWFLLNAGMIP